MRRTLLLVPALLAVFALVGPASSAQSQVETATLDITKVVDGPGPTGGYVIEYSCVAAVPDGNSVPEGFSDVAGVLNFDAAGPGSPETQSVELFGPGTCTISETDSNGAVSVGYECEFSSVGTPVSPDSPFAEGDQIGVGSCLDDQSAQITRPRDVASFTVTNTFVAEPPDVADVVAATPPFTG